jgi:hypothetical protein
LASTGAEFCATPQEERMTYTARSRDRFRALTAAITGLTTLGVVAATGAATGLAAASTAARDAARQRLSTSSEQTVARLGNPRHPVVWQRRPHRVVIDTRIIRAVSTPDAARPGGAAPAPYTGPVQSGPGGASGAGGGTGGGGTSGHAGSSGGPLPAAPPAPAPAPAPPPPAPTPAPTSGS